MSNYRRDDIDQVRQEKLKAYEAYLTATVQLKEALENEEMTKVTRLLEKRDILATRVNGLDQLLRRYQEPINFTGPRTGQDPVTDRLDTMLRSILAANADCDSLSVRKCVAIKSELIVIRQKEAGLHGYTVQPQRLPVFLSVKS